jgi:hypothetical protein
MRATGWKGKVVNLKKEQKKRMFEVISGGVPGKEPSPRRSD